MRSIVTLVVVAVMCALVVLHRLPEGDAHADPILVRTQQVQSISIDGGRGLPVTQLRQVLSTKLGDVVDTATLERDRAAMEHELATRGYLAAKVESPIVTYGPAGGVYVVFEVERGPLFHIRNVHLEGAGWTDAGVVPLAGGDVAHGGRIERVRQAAEQTLARHGKRMRVEVSVETDHGDAMVDVRLTTR